MSGIPPEKFINYGVKKRSSSLQKLSNKEIIKNKTELHYFSYYHNWVNKIIIIMQLKILALSLILIEQGNLFKICIFR